MTNHAFTTGLFGAPSGTNRVTFQDIDDPAVIIAWARVLWPRHVQLLHGAHSVTFERNLPGWEIVSISRI